MMWKNEKGCFLDMDGVLCKDSGYPHRVSGIRILPGVVEVLKLIGKAGYLVIVVSNQSGVAKGLFDEKDVRAFNKELAKRLEKGKAKIAGESCLRKPSCQRF